MDFCLSVIGSGQKAYRCQGDSIKSAATYLNIYLDIIIIIYRYFNYGKKQAAFSMSLSLLKKSVNLERNQIHDTLDF